MKTGIEVSEKLEKIISYMEIDGISIAPYQDGYIIASGSKQEKKLENLDKSAIQKIGSPYENYVFVTAAEWIKVKDILPKSRHIKSEVY